MSDTKVNLTHYHTFKFPQMDGTTKFIHMETAQSVIRRWDIEDKEREETKDE